MFAYCNNSPINLSDGTGQVPFRSNFVHTNDLECGGTGLLIGAAAVGGSILLGPMIQEAFDTIGNAITEACREIYEYSKAIKSELVEMTRKTPHVHHIVPVGSFSSRSESTKKKVAEMHQILADEGISRWFDPNNLMLVSAGTHATLHTDAYIAHVYSYIKPTAGSRDAIYATLFFLRIEIAAWDSLALGY